ncbi:hypothetical protein [Escherichia phage FS2B]|nr:hypothetical protein [Escherichia phage FS2B]
MELRPRLERALAASLAPVPPCVTDSAVVSPVRDVISEFVPEAAAPKIDLEMFTLPVISSGAWLFTVTT